MASPEVLINTSIGSPLTKDLKVSIDDSVSESLPISAPIQPHLEVLGHLAQLLSQVKLFTSGSIGSARHSPSTSPLPLSSEKLHQALATLQSCFVVGSSTVLFDSTMNTSFINCSNMLLRHPDTCLWINELLFVWHSLPNMKLTNSSS